MKSGLSGSLHVGLNFELIKEVLQLKCYVHCGLEALLIILWLAASLLSAGINVRIKVEYDKVRGIEAADLCI